MEPLNEVIALVCLIILVPGGAVTPAQSGVISPIPSQVIRFASDGVITPIPGNVVSPKSSDANSVLPGDVITLPRDVNSRGLSGVTSTFSADVIIPAPSVVISHQATGLVNSPAPGGESSSANDVKSHTPGRVSPSNDGVTSPANGSVVHPVFDDVIRPANGGVTRPVFDGVISPANDSVIRPVFDGVISPANGSVIRPVFDGVISPANGSVIRPVFDGVISPANGSVIRSVFEGVIIPLQLGMATTHPATTTVWQLPITRPVNVPTIRLTAAEDGPENIHAECIKYNCKVPGVCYIPHPRDCHKFIVCKTLDIGDVIAQVMPCAFGTFWKSGAESTCDRYDIVSCHNDPCKQPNVTMYDHPDFNCRTYWQCDKGKSRPACCEKYHRFDLESNTCVRDAYCDQSCPLLNDATCASGQISSVNLPDGNCRTYWDCQTGHPYPVCCPRDQAYSVIHGACVPNATCTDTCPAEYSDTCAKRGVTSYDLIDGNCRTFMKCNKLGQDDPYCCLPGMMYDATFKKCVDGKTGDCINVGCPYGYMEECRLEPIADQPNMYKNLDAFGGTVMPCPVGTVFKPLDCQCGPDSSVIIPSPAQGCSIAIHAKLPGLKNLGSAIAALLMIGEYGQGETGVGNMTSFWDGRHGINIPFYGSQEFWKFYLEMRFQPTASSPNKQILLSSCMYVDALPTLEVSLSRSHLNSGILKLQVRNQNLQNVVEIDQPYNFNDEILYRVMYDGESVSAFLEANKLKTNIERKKFSGAVPVDISGLRFAHCRFENNVSSFIGYMSEIKFSKCLTNEMVSLHQQAKLPAV